MDSGSERTEIMALRIDDKIFAAWIKGDVAAYAELWHAVLTAARVCAGESSPGKDGCIAGQSAGDIATIAAQKLADALSSERVVHQNLSAYLKVTVRRMFIDLVALPPGLLRDHGASGDTPPPVLSRRPAVPGGGARAGRDPWAGRRAKA